MSMKSKMRVLIGAAGGGLALAVACVALAKASKAGEPTAVVTVNLNAVLEKLDQRSDSQVKYVALLDKIKSEDEAKQAEIVKLQDQLKDMKDESQARQDLQEKVVLTRLEYEAWKGFQNDQIEVEQALILEDLFRSIKTAAAQMATAAGYDVVLVDDSKGELVISRTSQIPRDDQVRQQINTRRMLYGNPTIDITDELITRMNNAHKAGVAAAGTGAKTQ